MKDLTLIVRSKSGKTELQTITEDEFINAAKKGRYSNEIINLRELYPRIRMGNRGVMDETIKMQLETIPKLILQAAPESTRNSEQWHPTGLVVLQANNLPSKESVEKLRNTVIKIPYTRMAFRGATGFDLKIVCAYTIKNDMAPEAECSTHTSAYANLHYIYSSQLNMHLDNSKPDIKECIAMTHDPEAYYNPEAVEYVVVDDSMPGALNLPNLHMTDSLLTPDNAEAWANIYEHCHTQAINMAYTIPEIETDGFDDVVLSLLAQYCAKSGVPLELAVTRTLWKLRYRLHEDLTRRVFQNEYESMDKAPRPLGTFTKPELTARRTRAFMERSYSLRRNVLSDEVEFCRLNGYDYTYRPLDEATLNTMSQEARFAGVGSSRQKQDIIEYAQSSCIYRYDPIADWLDALPQWDGKDYVKELLDRLPTRTANYKHFMHIWLLSMVAHWMGKGGEYGNAIAPLLIGNQGCGKSSFCAKLLPEELRRYFNDNVSFRSEHDLNLNLSSFLLINIDEFDKLKASEQPVLKYLLSKSDVKGRVPYGINIEVRRRYASFIATTNSRQPLSDPTGSRRFVCVEITDGATIDHESPLNYRQLYAQLVAEINNGARYWFNNEENQIVMSQNKPYLKVKLDKQTISQNLVEMVPKIFRHPTEGEVAPRYTLREIAVLLRENGAVTGTSIGDLRHISGAMKANGFGCVRGAGGMVFCAVLIDSNRVG